jgi:hypothetical protein
VNKEETNYMGKNMIFHRRVYLRCLACSSACYQWHLFKSLQTLVDHPGLEEVLEAKTQSTFAHGMDTIQLGCHRQYLGHLVRTAVQKNDVRNADSHCIDVVPVV